MLVLIVCEGCSSCTDLVCCCLWQLGFTKTVSSLWAMTMLCLYVRVQVNILGRHLYVETARGLGSSQLLVSAFCFSLSEWICFFFALKQTYEDYSVAFLFTGAFCSYLVAMFHVQYCIIYVCIELSEECECDYYVCCLWCLSLSRDPVNVYYSALNDILVDGCWQPLNA